MSLNFPARMKQLRKTAAAWTTANTVLLAGEIGLESDTSKIKVGDGTTAWNSLAYGGIKGDAGSNGADGLSYFAVVTDATTARTLALTDAKKYIRCTSSSAIAVTVPPQSSVAWAADTEIVIERAGTGSLTIVAGAGVTLVSPRTLVADVQYSAITLKRIASDSWVVSGGTV
jgi:hypothetical protein